MPNYVTHRMLLRGEESVLAAIRSRHYGPILNHKGEASDYQWDFDTIIPMPQELKDIPRDGVSRLDEYLGELATMRPYPTHDYRRGERLDRKEAMYPLAEMCGDFARYHPPAAGATSYADLLRRLDGAPPYQTQHMPRVEMSFVDLAKAIGRSIEACGYGDSLTWCTEQWGTKWGSFRCAIDEATIGDGSMEFRFETAWSVPTPVLRKFASMYPHIQMHGHAFDEGWNFEAEIVAFNGWCATEERKATKETYAYVYGRPHVEETEDAA